MATLRFKSKENTSFGNKLAAMNAPEEDPNLQGLLASQLTQASNTAGKAGPRRKEELVKNGMRPFTLEEAKAKFVKRFTLDHMPLWAKKICPRSGKYPGPHYDSDTQWYARTEFIGYGTSSGRKYIRETKPTYPMGKWLDSAFDWVAYVAAERIRRKDSELNTRKAKRYPAKPVKVIAKKNGNGNGGKKTKKK